MIPESGIIQNVMNARHKKTLDAIFAVPTRKNIRWADIETLLMALGAERLEGSGSRVRFWLRGLPLFIHRPHPKPTAKPYQIEDVRQLLVKIGVTP